MARRFEDGCLLAVLLVLASCGGRQPAHSGEAVGDPSTPPVSTQPDPKEFVLLVLKVAEEKNPMRFAQLVSARQLEGEPEAVRKHLEGWITELNEIAPLLRAANVTLGRPVQEGERTPIYLDGGGEKEPERLFWVILEGGALKIDER